ncbi:hypothetical protein ACSG7Z_002661 [Cronobacter dublinensis]
MQQLPKNDDLRKPVAERRENIGITQQAQPAMAAQRSDERKQQRIHEEQSHLK